MKWKPRSIAGRAIAVGVLAFTTVVVGMAPAASAAGIRSGDAVPTNPMTNAPVPNGGSSTSWTLNLPTQASCRGDTASQGFHVYSFIVPVAVDVGTLTFNPSTGPSQGFPLIDNIGSPYIAANTAAVTGQVIQIPTFNFNLFASTDQGGTKIPLPPGDYKAGIACANTTGQGDKYWETIFSFTANGGDPNGEVWTNHPNHAVVTTSGCKNTTTAAAEMGHYPAWPGDQSYLRVACIFQHASVPNPPGDMVSSTFTIHDFANVIYHNGAARTMTANAASAVGATTISVADCRGAAAFVNRGITGPGLANRTNVTSVVGGCVPGGTLNLNKAIVGEATVSTVAPHITSNIMNFTAADNGMSVDGTNIPAGATLTVLTPTTANISIAPTANGGNQTITIGGTLDGGSVAPLGPITTTRTFNDGTYPVNNQVTSAAARFFASDVGLPIRGAGLPVPCFITVRNTATNVTLSCTNDLSGGNHTLTVGDPSRTAPLPTDTVLNQSVQLPLNPVLVPGSASCALDQAAGFGIEGTWVNPGSFVNPSTQPAGTKAIGQILFTTSVVSFAAYVLEIPGGLGIDPLIAGYHFNVVFPNVPTGAALCPSTPTSSGFGFSIGINGTTVSQAAIATGFGRPATAQLRSTRASTTGATSTIFLTDDVNGGGIKWTGSEFNRLCGPLPAGPAVINFTCGDG
jgi:hypothetical protein